MSPSFDDLSPAYDVLFDPVWYARSNLDVAAQGGDLLAHFIDRGWREGRDPHPLFRTRWYSERYPEAAAYPNPLLHYYELGCFSGANPNPLFDGDWYAVQHPAARSINPLEHFILTGGEAQPHPFVDAGWYGRMHADWAQEGLTAYEHLVAIGFGAGRSPHPAFDAAWFVSHNGLGHLSAAAAYAYFVSEGAALGLSPHPLFDPELYRRAMRLAGLPPVNPFFHFLLGKDRRRSPHPLFDAQYYADAIGLAADKDAFLHFLGFGQDSAQSPHPLFDPAMHRAAHADAGSGALGALRHFCEVGAGGAQTPSLLFDAKLYALFNPKVLDEHIEPLIDYAGPGPAERRHPHPLFDARYQKVVAKALGDPLVEYLIRKREDPIIGRPAAFGTPREKAFASDGPEVEIHIVGECDEEGAYGLLQALRAQTYLAWRLWLSDEDERRPLLKVARQVGRLEGRISVGSQTKASRAAGAYVVCLPAHAHLFPAALSRLVGDLEAEAADAIYAGAPPDWSWVASRDAERIDGVLMLRRTALRTLRRKQPTEARQFYDLMVRLSGAPLTVLSTPGPFFPLEIGPELPIEVEARAAVLSNPGSGGEVSLSPGRLGKGAKAAVPLSAHLMIDGRLSAELAQALIGIFQPKLASDAMISILSPTRRPFPQIVGSLMRAGNDTFLYLPSALSIEEMDWLSPLQALLADPKVALAAPTLHSGIVSGKRSVVERIGGASADFVSPLYGFADLSVRAHAAGYRTIGMPDPTVEVEIALTADEDAVDRLLYLERHGRLEQAL